MRIVIPGLLASLLLMYSVPSRANEPLLLPLVPDHVGLTTKKSPSLCWIRANKLPVSATMMFTLMDSSSIKPIIEVQLPSSLLTEENKTCHCVNLKDYDIQLEADIQYRWYISINQNPESHSHDIVAGGVIERCEFVECLMTPDLPSGCDMESVKTLARLGFWYDSISCLCDLIKSNPEDKSLRRALYFLMKQLDLRHTEPDYLIPLERWDTSRKEDHL